MHFTPASLDTHKAHIGGNTCDFCFVHDTTVNVMTSADEVGRPKNLKKIFFHALSYGMEPICILFLLKMQKSKTINNTHLQH
jgi:hypothetical protein